MIFFFKFTNSLNNNFNIKNKMVMYCHAYSRAPVKNTKNTPEVIPCIGQCYSYSYQMQLLFFYFDLFQVQCKYQTSIT